MKQWLGPLLCLLAGCSMQPGVHRPHAHGNPTGPTSDLQLPQLPPTVLRVGMEHLPPNATAERDASPIRVEGLGGNEPAARRNGARPATTSPADRRRDHVWTMSADDFAAIDDPVARETLHFVHDLVGEDQRRARREVGTPLLTWQARAALDDDQLLPVPGTRQQEQAEWFQTEAPRLLQRPLRLLARRLPWIQAFEDEVDDFRSDHVPLSAPYRSAHEDDSRFGRLSLRLRVNDPSDPAEVVWIHRGVRIGTGQSRLKLGFVRDLGKDFALSVHTSSDYDTGRMALRADLTWYLSPTTNLHFVVGDQLDFLATSSPFSLLQSPADGTPGLAIHAVHVF